MPVRKFKDPSEMARSVWCAPGDPRLIRRIAHVWGLAQRLAPQFFPPGVYKHRSIEELNRQTEEWARTTPRGPKGEPSSSWTSEAAPGRR